MLHFLCCGSERYLDQNKASRLIQDDKEELYNRNEKKKATQGVTTHSA